MKIVLATGIFPPVLGGPACLVLDLKDKLTGRGCRTEVLTFGDCCSEINRQGNSTPIHCLQRTNTVSNYLRYFFKLKRLVEKEDAVLAFDALSVGWPAALVKRFRGNRLIIRIGGDFLWEQSVERGWTNVSLPEFYRQPFNWRQKLRFWLIKWTLKSADRIILTNQWFYEIIKKPYGLKEEQVEIIGNYYPESLIGEAVRTKTAVAAGRLIKVKNFERLIKVFNSLEISGARLVIYGEGPLKEELKRMAKGGKVELRPALSQEALFGELARCRFYIQPSLSEVSPNTVLQALSARSPVLMTKYSGFEFLKDSLAIFDPFDESDLKSMLELFYDDSFYAKQLENVKSLDRSYTLAEAVEAYLKSFLKL